LFSLSLHDSLPILRRVANRADVRLDRCLRQLAILIGIKLLGPITLRVFGEVLNNVGPHFEGAIDHLMKPFGDAQVASNTHEPFTSSKAVRLRQRQEMTYPAVDKPPSSSMYRQRYPLCFGPALAGLLFGLGLAPD